jgi:biotin--protein ligase
MQQKPSIKIYSGKGVERRSFPALLNELEPWTVSSISCHDVIHTDWESHTDLFILPGGRDIPYHEDLEGEGNQRIRKFVEEGGSFLGICAGAYYGCREVEFDRGMELEVVGLRELAFFPGTARGPAYGPGSFRYHSEFGAKAALISNNFEKTTLRSYYNGGCFFVDAERYSHIHVISTYLEVETHPAAMIEIPIGKGKALLSGVHIEIGSSFPATLKKEMRHALQPFEIERRRFFQQLLHRLLNLSQAI